MIKTTLKDAFGQHYIIRLHLQFNQTKAVQPTRFSSPFQADRFIRHLCVPYGYWDRILNEVYHRIGTPLYTGRDTLTQISDFFYRQRLFAYKLHDYDSNTDNSAQKRSFEKTNGDKYTFTHPSTLLIPNAPEPLTLRTPAEAKALLNHIIHGDSAPKKDDKKQTQQNNQKINELAHNLNLTPLSKGAAVDASTNKNRIIAALVAGDVIVIEQKSLAMPPPPTERLPLSSADKPAQPVAAEFVAVSIPEIISNIKQQDLADALFKATENKAAFCVECEKAKMAAANNNNQ